MTSATGGYILTRQPLVRTGILRHTAALDRPVSESDLQALNAVQETPWRINAWLLDVLLEAFSNEAGPFAQKSERAPSIPARLPDETWDAMDEEARRSHTAARRDAHAKRAKIEGRRQALLDQLTVAREMRDAERIWFPHTKDFRGRIYPIPTAGPHPQSDDVGRALIMFADGLPLGPDGEFWLHVRAANCYGMDKLALEDRVQWSLRHQSDIFEAAADPLGSSWWTKADEPWSFLATCYELSQMWDSASPEEFVSHLPIPLDGSCNGLQHLAAMGLDPVGARATNLCPGPRQDIYEEVAAHVRETVRRDIAAGHPVAPLWDGRVTRAVCKRAVMTTPYGVTAGGIRTQLLNDGHVEAPQEAKGDAASYMRDCLTDALGATVMSARAIMAWLQAVAKELAVAGVPFDWSTPTGSRCRQAYTVMSEREIRTLAGRITLVEQAASPILVPKKQALGSAPNFVHSFDASHLSMTVLAAVARGIEHFAMVHDSYATHARHTTRLGVLLREAFVEIYRHDWLKETYEDIRRYAPHVQIPEPPLRGTFDITQVLDAPFFFS